MARHSVSVAAVVVDDVGRALLIRRRDNGHWEPPGGILELGEEIIDGLRREVAEETGLNVEPIALTGVYKNMRQGIVALVFRCAQAGGRLTTASETAEFRWADLGEVAGLADPAYAIRVTDALDFATRPQSGRTTACDSSSSPEEIADHHQPAPTTGPIAAFSRSYSGCASQVRAVRTDMQAMLGDCPFADDIIVSLSELAANAALHSKSRHPGGQFTVRAEIHPGDYA